MTHSNESRIFTLGHLTVERLAPPDLVAQAARAGFRAIGIRFWDGFTDQESYPIQPGSPMLRETMRRLDSVDLAVPEIENIVLNPETDANKYRPMFEVGALLGAKRVIVGSVVDDESLCTALYARLCEVGAEFGLDIALEFYLKWRGCASIGQGRRILANAAQPNGKLLVDALHLNRSGGTPAELAAMPVEYLASLQLCDAPAGIPQSLDEISVESRFQRMLPGEGGLDLRGVMQAYPADSPLGLEAPNRSLEDEIGSQAYLERCYWATRRFVDSLAVN